MPKVANLGKLVDLSPGFGTQPPVNHNAMMAVADSASISDKEVADKAVQDAKETPSVWFVNFPEKSTTEQADLLKRYMQNVQDYRCWASLIWWRTVFGNSKIPQDGSKESIATRSAYCAKVAVHHMKTTPWLAMNQDRNVSKEIKCQVTDFHTELVKAVLEGFVDATPAIIKALEGILESLRRTISQSTSNSENRTIVCERYEYLPQADVIRSHVRVASFSVTDSMRNVQNAKKTESWVECTIDYNDYGATFNQKLWNETAAKIEQDQKTAADEFRKRQTVDCPP